MLDRGLTEDGAAQALGWPKQRVTARVKILELPERAQQLIGEGVIHLAAVDQLRAIGTVAPDLLDAVVAYLDDGNAWAAERLTREPGWVLDAALTHSGNGKVFAAYLHSAGSHEIAELRLGKKTEQVYADAATLHKQLDRYAYGPPAVRFTDADIDQARAAGVLIEFERGRPIIVDRPLYRELVKGAIKRTHDELEAKADTAAKEKKATRADKRDADPVTVAKRERDARLRELTDQAHAANTDLGHALVHKLANVDPTDLDVARFFVYALLGADHDSSPYTQTGERVVRIAAGGILLVIDELRTDATKTRKDGSRGRLRYDYGDHRDPQAALRWLWKLIVCRAAGYAERFLRRRRRRCSARGGRRRARPNYADTRKASRWSARCRPPATPRVARRSVAARAAAPSRKRARHPRSATRSRFVELVLNGALDDQPRPEPRQLRQRLARVLAHPHGKQPLDLLLDLRRRRYRASHRVGPPSIVLSGPEGTYAVPSTGPAIYSSWETRPRRQRRRPLIKGGAALIGADAPRPPARPAAGARGPRQLAGERALRRGTPPGPRTVYQAALGVDLQAATLAGHPGRNTGVCRGVSIRGRGTCTPRTDRSGPILRGSSGMCCRRGQADRPCSAGGPRPPVPRRACLAGGRPRAWR